MLLLHLGSPLLSTLLVPWPVCQSNNLHCHLFPPVLGNSSRSYTDRKGSFIISSISVWSSYSLSFTLSLLIPFLLQFLTNIFKIILVGLYTFLLYLCHNLSFLYLYTYVSVRVRFSLAAFRWSYCLQPEYICREPYSTDYEDWDWDELPQSEKIMHIT